MAAATWEEVEQQAEPDEDDEEDWGGGGGAFAGPSLWADSDPEWRDAPRADSDALFELNMQLAAYAKDAQWEMAIMLLRQARVLSKRSSADSEEDERRADTTATVVSDIMEGGEEEEEEEEGTAKRRYGVHPRGDDNLSVSVPSTSAAEEEEEWPLAVPVVEPNVVSYNNVITACANAKKQKRAEGIFREMTKERGIRPNVFTYGALISACAKRGNWEDSVNYLEVRYV
ncbi:unnamed protein product [Ectocarpus sp. 8 AP-2014]